MRPILLKYRPKWSLSKKELFPKEIYGQNLGIFRQKVAQIWSLVR
jgi:hypothetical protein